MRLEFREWVGISSKLLMFNPGDKLLNGTALKKVVHLSDITWILQDDNVVCYTITCSVG